MKQIRDAVEIIRKMRERVKDSAFLSTEELNAFIPLLDLAEKVLAAKMPEKRECPSEFCSTEADAKNAEWNQAIDQCTLAITGALLSVEELVEIIDKNDNPIATSYEHSVILLATAIHKAQMEKLGGVR